MSYIRITWPDSQEYMRLSEEEMQEYGIITGPDCSFLIPEDNIDEVEALLNGELEDEEEDKIMLYTDDEEGWLDRELYRECADLSEEDDTDDEAYYDWVRSSKEDMLDDMREALLKNLPNTPVVITGKLGLWNGSREILPEIIADDKEDSNVWVAIRKCAAVSSDRSLDIALNTADGSLEVTVRHHDGTNVFTLRKVAEASFDDAGYIKDNGEDAGHKVDSLTYDEFTPEEFEL